MATVRFKPEKDPFLEREIEMFTRMNPKSGEHWGNACQYLPAGTTRGLSYFPPFPPYVLRGEGCWVYDMGSFLQRHINDPRARTSCSC
jgi:hypothetical protein